MPIYAYRCRSCGRREEYIQKIADPPMRKCEHCGGRLDKQVTTAAFHLKGGGWYKDGYASKAGGSGTDGDGGDSGTKSADAAQKKTEKTEKKAPKKADSSSSGSTD